MRHIPHELAADCGCRGSEGDRLPITAIQAEPHAHLFAVITADFEAVGTIPLVRTLYGNLSFVDTHRRSSYIAL
jgi:hypothetical protein